MATKKQNRRWLVRQVRRVLNSLMEPRGKGGGRKDYSRRYGGGIHRSDFKKEGEEQSSST